MRIHKEGNRIILFSLLMIVILAVLVYMLIPENLLSTFLPVILSILFVILVLVVQFFRLPNRVAVTNNQKIIAPADGRVVVIEKITETEYFNDQRLQISIFMSPLNVHVNWYPVSGKVIYSKYHPGKYLVAWHPKSSTENERTTVVIRTESGKEIMVRQIAGALARRICCYANEGATVKQGAELGFIKFGSRVDVIIPVDCKIDVHINQITKGLISNLASF